MKFDFDIMEPSQEAVVDTMLWQDSNANQNSQEQSLADQGDFDGERGPNSSTLLEWDNSNFNWNTQTNREDIFSQLNTPTRVQQNLDWPNVDPLPISSSQSSAADQFYHRLTNSTEEECSEDFYPYSQSSEEREVYTNMKVKKEPEPADPAVVSLGVVKPFYYQVKEEVVPSPVNLIAEDELKAETDQDDLLQQALTCTMISLPLNMKQPEGKANRAIKRDAPVNDKKMVPLMKKYKLDDSKLSDMTLDRLKVKCRVNKADYETLAKYRRTCMNRYYARRSRNNKVNVTQTLEEQLSTALQQNEDLKATIAKRDAQISQLQQQLERID